MARLFNKSIKSVGLPPGTLPDFNLQNEYDHIHLSIVEYTESQLIEKDNISLEECLQHLITPEKTWIQVNGVSDPRTVAALGKHFQLHPLVLEDIVTKGQRSKLDEYENQVFIVVRVLQYDEKHHCLKDEQVSIVFGPNYLICFFEGLDDIFKPIKERLKQENNRIRKLGTDYLAYTLIDLIIDYYFLVLEKVDVQLDVLEEELLNSPKKNTVERIQKAKKEMIILRKSVWPVRDVINRFLRLEPPLVSATTQIYLHDVYDHTVQTIDIIEGFRDVVSGMMDIYLSNINIRTNEIMKFLTIVSTIFVPLTFVSSLYGMNFEFMPELHYPWAYPAVLFLMLGIALVMLSYFYRKKWL
ncbi:MAG: magnesium/cobalt transporter CorA [Parachlamydiaceae bacterium]|nr:magnesium/cobalt transporter CorA [Parachlamydiaceae bacterium]